MTPPTSSPGTARFGPYEVNVRSGEVRKFGVRLKLGEQPLQILLLLIERPGELVTREEFRALLWSQDTFVDFDHSLNSAVRRLRESLSDTAERGKWIETVPRRGYRFLGTVEWTRNDRSAAEGITSSSDEPAGGVAPEQVLPQPREQIAERFWRRGVFLDVEQGDGPGAMDPSTGSPEKSRWPWFSVWALVGAVALAFAFAVVAYVGGHRTAVSSAKAGHVMLAVLPFENLSGDPNRDYFSDGLTEEIITQLGALSPEQLGVIARTTSMAYKRTSKSAQQIARELGVDYILESSVRRDRDQLRISVQLIRTRDQVHVWAQSYDRQISDSITLQEEVAKAVAEQIRVKLSPSHSGSPRSRPLDPQANEAYLRGRYFGNQFTVGGYRKAIAYFQQAIDRDPSFAEAYSGLADSYYFLVVTDAMSPQAGESKALESARQAVRLGEDLAESHNALGSVMLGLWDWSQAEVEFKRAIELNPSYSTEHRLYAALHVTLRRHAEAWEQINQAMRTDPLSLPNNAEMVRTLYYTRDYDRAVEQAKKAQQLDPDYYRIHFWLARVYSQKGMHREAILESEKVVRAMPDSTVGLTELAYSLAVGGRQPEARKILQTLEERSKHDFVPAYNLAILHTALNENDTALRYLQRAYEERDWALMVLAVEPRLDPLRGAQEFRELLVAVRLPSSKETNSVRMESPRKTGRVCGVRCG